MEVKMGTARHMEKFEVLGLQKWPISPVRGLLLLLFEDHKETSWESAS
jgi:hypothetical protein